METVSKFIGNSNFQCVQAVRALKIPGFPQSGLTTIADKLKNLVNTSAGFKPGEMMPQVLDTIVLDYGVIDPTTGQNYGHVATVLGTNPETGEVTFQNHNIPKNKGSISTISLKNAKIKGYWRSPAVKVQQAQSSPQDDTMAMALGRLPAATREYTQELYNKYMQSGKVDAAKKLVDSTIIETMDGTTKTAYINAADMGNLTQSAIGTINSIQADTGLYKTFFESGKTLLDMQKDPAFVEQNAAVFNVVNKIINDLSGAAVSDPELQRLELGLPSKNDKPADMLIKLNAVRDMYRKRQSSLFGISSGSQPIPDGPDGKISVQLSDGSTTRMDPYEYSQLLSGQ